MIDLNEAAYFEREQSAVKQYILREYLLPFALIIGTFSDICYVDCCAGPWQSRSEDYADTSFGNAVSALTGAKEVLGRSGQSPKISCLFVEKEPAAFEQLKRFCANVKEIQAEALQGDFTQKISEIKAFLKQQGMPFPFFFIDPTGWKPIRMPSIKPILQINPGEVLINFMTSHIRRFLGLESLELDALFGEGHTSEIAGLHGTERDEAAVFAYASEVMKAISTSSTGLEIGEESRSSRKRKNERSGSRVASAAEQGSAKERDEHASLACSLALNLEKVLKSGIWNP